MTAADLVAFLERYARSFAAPVAERTTVQEVRTAPGGGYLVRTNRGSWAAANLVIATGYFASPQVPALKARLAADLRQLTPADYRGPAQVPDGGVLVVGASASGVQIADELQQAGRRVVLAVGAHTRLPRHYRGRDILWWLERMGSLDRTIVELPDAERERARREPSLQLGGTRLRMDLTALQERGVRLAGRLTAVEADGTMRFGDDLAETTAAVWATGLRPRYPWLKVPVLDATGLIRHRRGITTASGLYAIGLRFQHRRSSTWIDGARHDATFIADHIAARQ